MGNPVLVEVWRGELVECRHRGAVAICDASGRLHFALGDVSSPVYPRSATKLLQALPLVESGAAAHYALSAAEMALACASHNGETLHAEAVAAWLERLDLGEEDLECGPALPMGTAAHEALLRAGGAPSRLFHNCSGKHCGMLTLSRHLDARTRGYIDEQHPAQQQWMQALGEMAGVDAHQLPRGLDGCGIPVLALPLARLAQAFARFADPRGLAAPRREAIEKLRAALQAMPQMIAGSDRLCSELLATAGLQVQAKVGADGVYAAALPELGLGVALKIDDGNTRASEVALGAALSRLRVLDDEQQAALAARFSPPIINSRGLLAGRVEASSVWCC
jgi:L-asparaginase II